MELNPQFMEPMKTARELTEKLDTDLLQAWSDEIPQKLIDWRNTITAHQYVALHNRDVAETTYLPGSPAYVAYHLSFKYAMRAYSRCKAQIIFWGEGGKGIIPMESECHRN